MNNNYCMKASQNR